MAFIYYLKCPIINKPRYVGQTILGLNKRLQRHISEFNSKLKQNETLSHKENWLKILKEKEKLSDLTIHLIEQTNIDKIDEKEIFWIKKYRKLYDLTNIQGGGQKFHFQPEETKKKISKANSGKRNGMFGKRFKKSPELIEKTRLAMISSKKFQSSRKSKEYREKISKLQSRPILLLNNNLDIVKEFSTCTECAKYFGFTRGNIKNAVRDLRQIGKSFPEKYWVIRKNKLTESIRKINDKKI